MMGSYWSFFDSRSLTDFVALLGGLLLVVASVLTANEHLLIAGSYPLLLGTSTAVVTFGLVWFTGQRVSSPNWSANTGFLEKLADIYTGRALETESDIQQDTGWLIGRLENVIVLTLVYSGEFTALSVIFAAKSFVRHDDISSDDTAYYLAGTLLNFTYSIAVGMIVMWLGDPLSLAHLSVFEF